MLLALKLKAGLTAAVLAAPLAVSAIPSIDISSDAVDRAGAAETVTLAPGPIAYRPAGDFSRAGQAANAPLRTMRLDRALTIMKRQVTAAEYQRCVDASACPQLAGMSARDDHPVVGVSWRDADAYAAWLSRETGERYRLPTDEEWAFAAGSRFKDEALPETDAVDPSRRWLARYEAESQRQKSVREPQPIGTFGVNEHGLVDVAGNVWEWTDSCFVRGTVEAAGDVRATLVNCGVRVVEGAHRTYVTDFIRDARAGGCAVGTPPSNLGFRLVRDDHAWRPLHRILVWAGLA